MGFASYLEDIEDIKSRITTIEEIVREHSEPSHKREANGHEGLRKQNERLQGGINKLRTEIAELQLVIQQIKKDNAEKGFLIRKEQVKSDSLSKEIGRESELRKTHEKAGRDWSQLVFDFKHLFQVMNDITKSNAWHKDRAKIKRLESLIETGLRKN